MSNLIPIGQLPKVFAQKDRKGASVTVMIGGRHYVRTNNVEDIYAAAMQCALDPSETNLDTLQALLTDNLNKLVGVRTKTLNGDFVRDTATGQVFLEGTDVPLPDVLVQRLEESYENGWPLSPLVNFWTNCLLNPDPQAQKDFFSYLLEYGAPITDLGYAVLYKVVEVKGKEKVEVSKDLAAFVAESFTRVKRQKKGLSRFTVFQDDQGNLRLTEYGAQENETEVGNLEELHNRLDELGSQTETVYTDCHTRRMTIRLGQPVTMDRSQCDHDPKNGCSRGLHVGAHKYVSSFYNGGNAVVLSCLVNPRNVVAIPSYNNSKMRVCEYLPVGVMSVGGGYWEELESGYLELAYANRDLEQLREIAAADPDSAHAMLQDRRSRVLSRSTRDGAYTLPEAQRVYEEDPEVV